MRGRGVTAALGLLALVGCSTTTAPDAAPPSTAGRSVATAEVTTLTCAAAIDGDPPPDYATVLDVVALPTGRVLGAYDSGDPTAPALFAKTGLVVRAHASFELEVGQQTDDASIGWGNVSFRPSRRFVVPGCPDTYGTGWLAYPGGYWADQPLCLPISVRSESREQQVHIGVGTGCP